MAACASAPETARRVSALIRGALVPAFLQEAQESRAALREAEERLAQATQAVGDTEALTRRGAELEAELARLREAAQRAEGLERDLAEARCAQARLAALQAQLEAAQAAGKRCAAWQAVGIAAWSPAHPCTQGDAGSSA